MKIINIFFLIIERKIMTCEGKNFKNDVKNKFLYYKKNVILDSGKKSLFSGKKFYLQEIS